VRLALFIGLIQVIGTTFAGRHDQGVARPLNWLGYALVIAGPLALSVRKRYWPVSLIGAVAAALAYYALSFPGGPYFLAAFAAMASAILAGHRRPTWVVAGLGYAFVVGFGWLVPSIGGVPVNQPGIGGAIAVAAWTLVTLAVAEAIRNRASALAEIARTRAEQARTRAEQGRTRAEQQRRQASEERLRIAQELHDVVGHHLSLINVQAGVGLHLMQERPEQARVALQTIKAASSEALAEVRAVLGLLRAEEGEAAPRAPAPSLANLSVLLDTAQARLVTSGEPRALPPEVDRAAYRIVREALTNVRRHAGEAARATVTIGYLPAALTIEVTDNECVPTWFLQAGRG
jgi:signal transduction histidine kinase